MNNKALLTIVIVLLLGVIGIITVQMADYSEVGSLPGSIGDVAGAVHDTTDDEMMN